MSYIVRKGGITKIVVPIKEGKWYMTKESNEVVSEVNAVISSIRSKVQQEEKITVDDIDNLSTTVNELITDYKTVLNDYLVMNSLAVKHDKFLEVIGIIGFASANDVKVLDQTIKSLEKVLKTIKQR